MGFGFLTDREIKERGKELLGDEFDANLARHASYDLRLGSEVYISGRDYPDLLSTTKNRFVSIPRGQFALLITKEYVKLPADILGLISIRLGKKEQGLVNISGFHVDPGFEGKITFSVFNAGPTDVVLELEEPIFMIFFYKLEHTVDKPYDGSRKGQENLPTELVTSLKGTSASLSDVDKRVSRLEVTEKIFRVFLIALAVGLVGLFLQVILRIGK